MLNVFTGTHAQTHMHPKCIYMYHQSGIIRQQCPTCFYMMYDVHSSVEKCRLYPRYQIFQTNARILTHCWNASMLDNYVPAVSRPLVIKIVICELPMHIKAANWQHICFHFKVLFDTSSVGKSYFANRVTLSADTWRPEMQTICRPAKFNVSKRFVISCSVTDTCKCSHAYIKYFIYKSIWVTLIMYVFSLYNVIFLRTFW